jgi:DNA repair protein RAD7
LLTFFPLFPYSPSSFSRLFFSTPHLIAQQYTALSPSGRLLCSPCTSESIEDRATFPSAGGSGGGKGGGEKRPAAPKRKRSEKVQEETKWTEVKTLGQSCLSVRPSFSFLSSVAPFFGSVLTTTRQIIASLISTVEAGAFSYLGPKNLDRIAKIVSKNRMLDNENVKLFLEVGHRELRLYDCTSESSILFFPPPRPLSSVSSLRRCNKETKMRLGVRERCTYSWLAHADITDHSLSSISTFCPHLVHLSLQLCGRLDDDVLDAWSGHAAPSASTSTSPHFAAPAVVGEKQIVGGLKELKHLELYAPYLVTAGKWKEFFERRAEQGLEGLETFRLRMSARTPPSLFLLSLLSNPVLVLFDSQASTTPPSSPSSLTTPPSIPCNSPKSAVSQAPPSLRFTLSRGA